MRPVLGDQVSYTNREIDTIVKRGLDILLVSFDSGFENWLTVSQCEYLICCLNVGSLFVMCSA